MTEQRHALEGVWYGSGRGGLLTPLLSVTAAAYRAGMGLHRALYGVGVKKTAHPGVPCVSIGNIVVGGTGKTPMTAWLAKELRRRGRQPAIVSRGYGGTTIQPARVPAGGGSDDSRAFGDEPVMLATALPDVPVVVARDRSAAAAFAVSRHGADVIVADDAFQHWRLERDLDVVLVDGRRWFGNGRLLPWGPLRELPGALGRAQAVVLTRPAEDTGPARLGELQRLAPAAVIAAADILPAGLRPWGRDGGKTGPREPYFAFCGLADPRSFREAVESQGQLAGWKSFADHHHYDEEDLRDLQDRAARSGAAAAVTTAKDAVRLPRWGGRIPLFILDVSLRVTAGTEKIGELIDTLVRGKDP